MRIEAGRVGFAEQVTEIKDGWAHAPVVRVTD
jgi:hypothetical protein